MFIGVARFDLRVPDSSSRKDKRAVVRSLKALLHQKFACAVAEVDHLDLTQRTAIGVSVVSGEHFQARKVLQQIGRAIEGSPGVEIIARDEQVWSSEDR